MGGNYVYPGGRIDREDHSLEICSNCKGITPQEAQQVLGRDLLSGGELSLLDRRNSRTL